MFTISVPAPLRLLPLVALVTACMTYSNAGGRPITPQNDIRIRFPFPVMLRLTCDGMDSVASPPAGCTADSIVPGVSEVTGHVRSATGDSLFVAVQKIRDASGMTHDYSSPRLTTVARQTSLVQYRHTDGDKTDLIVVLASGVVEVIAEALQPTPPPTPKPGPMPITWC